MMRFNLRYLPMVSAAAGVLAGLDIKHRAIAVDHLTIIDVDPDLWDMVFLLSAETTFKIRDHMERIGDKLIVIATSREPGLNRWRNIFFPHWLFCITMPQSKGIHAQLNNAKNRYDALLGRVKDPRTRLLQELDKMDLLQHGEISYAHGHFYGPKNLEHDADPYLRGNWEHEENEIQEIYGNDLNYYLVRDSTLKMNNGVFSSCLIPRKIYAKTDFSLVAETDNIGDHVFITEKTWKPMMFNRQFVMYATPAHEDFLESIGCSIGYKTMGDPVLAAEAVKMMCEDGNMISQDKQNPTINRRIADPQRWYRSLYKWLDMTVRT